MAKKAKARRKSKAHVVTDFHPIYGAFYECSEDGEPFTTEREARLHIARYHK